MSALVNAVLEMLKVEGSILAGAIGLFFFSLFWNLIIFYFSMFRALFGSKKHCSRPHAVEFLHLLYATASYFSAICL